MREAARVRVRVGREWRETMASERRALLAERTSHRHEIRDQIREMRREMRDAWRRW